MITKINGVPITTQFHAIDHIHLHTHQGIDLAIPLNTPIPSFSDGIVTSLTNEGNASFGKAVHLHMSNGNNVIYGHLNQFNVRVGEKIHQGDVIGLSGSTGHSTGPHLHIQVMHNGSAIDPTQMIQQIDFSKGKMIGDASHYPIWDLKDRTIESAQGLEHWILSELHHLLIFIGHATVTGLTIALPTLATVGILYWMIPLFPRARYGLRVTGIAMLAFMFLVIIKGAINHGG